MKFIFFVVALAMASTSFAATGALTIKADTDYKNTVWSAVSLPRLYSANVLPANPQAAILLEKLDHRMTYVCQAEYYNGSVGYFNRDGEHSVIMLYALRECAPRR